LGVQPEGATAIGKILEGAHSTTSLRLINAPLNGALLSTPTGPAVVACREGGVQIALAGWCET